MKTTVPDKIKAHIIMTDTGEKTFFMRWLPVLTLTLCTFVFNTSEFIPIGLLTDIGRDFGRTEAEMGWLVTTYAWVVALMSLPLMLLASKMECRRLMMSVLALFVASHVLSAVASNYWILLASRLGVACSHAIFWSVVSPLAVEVAPKHKTSAALGLVVAGSSIAMIAGLPLGRVLGLYLGWRMTFLAIGLDLDRLFTGAQAAAAGQALLQLIFAPRNGGQAKLPFAHGFGAFQISLARHKLCQMAVARGGNAAIAQEQIKFNAVGAGKGTVHPIRVAVLITGFIVLFGKFAVNGEEVHAFVSSLIEPSKVVDKATYKGP